MEMKSIIIALVGCVCLTSVYCGVLEDPYVPKPLPEKSEERSEQIDGEDFEKNTKVKLDAEHELVEAGKLIDSSTWQIDTLARYFLEEPKNSAIKLSSWKGALFLSDEKLAEGIQNYINLKLGQSPWQLMNKVYLDMTFQYDLVEVCQKVNKALGAAAQRFLNSGFTTGDEESPAWRILAKAQICAKLVEKRDQLYEMVDLAERYP